MRTIEGKIVVLGYRGVGKTSMVMRYVGNVFSQHISPTVGASFFTCKINIESTRVKLQVWDTAGQERFRAMAPMYYRNANAALVVYDITDYHSFESAQTWVKELQRNVEEPLVLCVIGNKSDLMDSRAVGTDEAQQYATSIGAHYFETSALKGEGIEDVFFSAAKNIIELSKDPLCTSLRIYDSVDGGPATLVSSPTTDYVFISGVDNTSSKDEKKSQCC